MGWERVGRLAKGKLHGGQCGRADGRALMVERMVRTAMGPQVVW